MTLNINGTFGAQSTPADGDHPLGSSRDADMVGGEAVPNTGTPLVKVLIDDWLGSTQAILNAGGVAASGVGDVVGASDVVTAIQNMIAASSAPPTAVCSLSDVDCTGIMDGDSLRWNASASMFQPFSNATPGFGFGCLNTVSFTGDTAPVIFTSGTGSQGMIQISNDGLRAYSSTNSSSSGTIIEYTFGTAHVLSTMVPGATLFTGSNILGGICISSGIDVMLRANGSNVTQGNFGAPGDISTLSFGGIVEPVGSSIAGMQLSPDGMTLFTLHFSGIIQQWALAAPNQITGMVLANTFNFEALTGTGDLVGFGISESKVWVLDGGFSQPPTLYQFDLTADYDISAPTLTGGTGLPFDMSGTFSSGVTLSIAPTTTAEHIYVTGGFTDVYRLSTTTVTACP